eukprot:11644600-Alexandrium_andersonii.AAC.1
MSASLVGSEMCIRDRSSLAPRVGETSGPGNIPSPLGAQVQQWWPRPLLYTHTLIARSCHILAQPLQP